MSALHKISLTNRSQTGNILNTQTFTYLLANPQKISDENLKGLEVIIKKYPYFQAARALQLKGLKNQDSFLYNDALKITAAYTTDRDILFEYITSEKFIQNEISQLILKHDNSVTEMDVQAEDVSEQVSVEIDNQIKAELKKAEAILSPTLFERKPEPEPISPTIKEEILQPDKPLEFTQTDTHSFSEWLQLTKAKPIEREIPSSEDLKNEEIQNNKDRKIDLINKFIQDKPKILPPKIDKTKSSKEIQKISIAPYTQTPDSLMTETLAKVYLQQKNYKKAIQAYKILILKNPEKSGFFADQIRAIEKLINTEQS